MIGNLLNHFPLENLVVLTSSNRKLKKDPASDLDCIKYYVDLPSRMERKSLRYLLVPIIIIKAFILAKKYRIDSIYTQWPDTHFVIAAYIVSKFIQKPLFFWLHSLWREREMVLPDKIMTHLFEKKVILYAKKVFVATEAAQHYYFIKYGIEAITLYHSVDFSLFNKKPSIKSTNQSEKIILFAGGIYPPMNLDSLQRLMKAVEGIDSYKLRIILCTQTEPVHLKEWGLLGSHVDVKFVSRQELMELEADADILFLPLAFFSDMPLEIQTVFPTKTLEYLISGTPILIHVPQGCYLAEYALAKNFGYVVDQPDVALLRDGILRLLKDHNLRSQLISGAEKAATERDSRSVVNILKYNLLNCT